MADKERSEEKFTNVRIDTDGTIAPVSFEFTVHLDDRIINRGQESWHLVNTDSGWKIASVICSNNQGGGNDMAFLSQAARHAPISD